jgi:hypothetical protein
METYYSSVAFYANFILCDIKILLKYNLFTEFEIMQIPKQFGRNHVCVSKLILLYSTL